MNTQDLARIEELADLIKAKELELKNEQKMPQRDGSPYGAMDGDIRPGSYSPEAIVQTQQNTGLKNDLTSLNEELSILQNKEIANNEPLFMLNPSDYAPEDSDVEVPDIEPIAGPSYNELMQPYRDKYPGKSDGIIERLIKYENPELHQVIAGADTDESIKEDTPEYAQFQGISDFGEGFIGSKIQTVMHEHYKMAFYDMPAMELRRMKLMPGDTEENDERFRQVIRNNPKYKDFTNYEVEELLKSVKEDGKLLDNLAAEMMREGKEFSDKFYKENPELMAFTEWLASKQDGYTEKGGGPGIAKWTSGLLLDVGASILESRASGMIGRTLARWLSKPFGYIAGTAASAAAVNVPDPTDVITGPLAYKATKEAVEKGFEFGGEMLGQALYGYGMEGAAHLVNAVETLSNDEIYSKEKFLNHLTEIRKRMQNENFNMPLSDENIPERKPTIAEVQDMMNAYVKENFYKNKTGDMVRRGMDMADAIEMASASYKFYATGASLIETFDVWSRRMGFDMLYDVGKASYIGKSVMKMKDNVLYNNIVKNWNNLRKVQPGESPWTAFLKQGADVVLPSQAKTFAESIEELLQANLEAVTEAYGPVGIEEWKWNIGEELKNIVSWKTHFVEPLVGGILPGEFTQRARNVGTLAATTSENIGLTDYYANQANKDMTKRVDAGAGGLIVKPGDQPNEYVLYNTSPTINSEGNLVANETEITVDEENPSYGEVDIPSSRFGTYSEAKSYADEYNQKRGLERELSFAVNNSVYHESEVIVEKHLNYYEARIVGKNGDVIKQIGRFKEREDANDRASNARENIEKVNKVIDKWGPEETQKQKEINQNKDKKIVENIEEIVETPETPEGDKGPGFIEYLNKPSEETGGKEKHFKKGRTVSRKTAMAIFKGYMRKDKNNKSIPRTKEDIDIYQEIVDGDLHLDGEFLRDNFLYHADILEELNINKDEFKSDFIEQYPEFSENIDDIFKDDSYVDESDESDDIIDRLDDIIDDDIIDDDESFLNERDDLDEDIDITSPEFIKETKAKIAQLSEEIKRMEATGNDIGKRRNEWYEKLQERKRLQDLIAHEYPIPKVRSLQKRMTEKIATVIKSTAKKWLPKEQVKTKVATQFIGEGSEGSSTQAYNKMYEEENLSNTGKYNSDDIIYVSSNGKRQGRVNPVKNGVLQGVYKNIDKAIEAGAKIIMDTKAHLDKTGKYNIGELALAEYLESNGYVREGESGVWIPGKNYGEIVTTEIGLEKYIENIVSEFKGTKLTIRYDAYDNDFEVTFTGIDTGNIQTTEVEGNVRTIMYPVAIGITSKNNKVLFNYTEIVKGPEKLINQLEEIHESEIVERDSEDVITPDVVDGKVPILSMRKDADKFNYTSGQEKALKLISSFLDNKNESPNDFREGNVDVIENVFILRGYAGTGKTTLLENIIKYALSIGYKTPIYSAITNRAVMVIREKLKAVELTKATGYTIASLLTEARESGGMTQFEEKDRLFEVDAFNQLVIFDEASMIGEDEYSYIQRLLLNDGAKVIFVGDTAQLPPVKSKFQIFGLNLPSSNQQTELTQVTRQGLKSPVLALATAMRVANEIEGHETTVLYPKESIKTKNDGNLFVVEERELIDLFIKSQNGLIPMTMIVYTNANKALMNNAARKEKYSHLMTQKVDISNLKQGQSMADAALESLPVLNPGERIMVLSKSVPNNQLMVTNGETFTEGVDFETDFNSAEEISGVQVIIKGKVFTSGVSKVNEKFPLFKNPVLYKINTKNISDAYEGGSEPSGKFVKVSKESDLFENKNETYILVFPESPWATITNQDIDPSTLPSYFIHTDDNGKKYVSSRLVIATYGYAITAHKAQGSEFPVIGIAVENYMFNLPNFSRDAEVFNRAKQQTEMRDSMNFNKWFYTALTRAQQDAWIVKLNESQIKNNDIKFVNESQIKQLSSKALEQDKKTKKEKEDTKKYSLKNILPKISNASTQAKVRKFTKMLYDKFEGSINYQFINDANLTNKFGNPIGAFYGPISKEMSEKYGIKESKKPVVLINLALSETDTPFHEFLHPFIVDIRNRNPILYENLLKEILGSEAGREQLGDIIDAYAELGKEEVAGIVAELGEILEKIDGNIKDISTEQLYKLLNKYDNEDKLLSDELIAFMTGKAAANIASMPQKSKWRKILEDVLNWVRYRLFGGKWSTSVYARALDLNTSINDIARLLADSDKRFSLEIYDKKLTKEDYGFKVDSKPRFFLWGKKKAEKTLEGLGKSKEDELGRTDSQVLNRLFSEIWDMSKFDKNKKTRKEDFAAMMIGDKANAILPVAMQPAFIRWYRGKFNIKIEKGDNEFAIFNESVHDNVVGFMMDNEDLLNELMGRLETNEKESTLASASLLYIPELGYTLTEKELKYLIVQARKLDFVGNVPGETYWIDVLYSDILKIKKKKMPIWRKRALTKFYNQIQSTQITNRGQEPQNVINLEALFESGKDSENKPTTKIRIVRKTKEKIFKSKGEKTSNPGFQKKFLADSNVDIDNVFQWISTKDIKVKQMTKTGEENAPLYGYYDADQLATLYNELLFTHGLAVVFPRGGKLALVEIDNPRFDAKNRSENIESYIAEEISNGFMSRTQGEAFLLKASKMKKKAVMAEIAVHESIKSVWPMYLVHGGSISNIYKRLRIPFTPVTINEKMPDTIMYRFDPKSVLFQYEQDEPFSPRQKVKGKGLQYIGDGESITSTGEFQKYDIFHGLRAGTAIAKTVIYMLNGINALAVKHQHFQATPKFKILDKKTKEVLFKVSNNGNIYLGEGHADFDKNIKANNYVGMLSTKDEIKIGSETKDGKQDTIFKESDKVVIPGSSVGFIKFEEGMDKHARHPQQWYNYVYNERVLKHFVDHYLPKVEKSIRDVLRLAVDSPNSTSAEKISKIMQKLSKPGDDTRISSFQELLNIGAGHHLQTAAILDRFLFQNKISDDMQLGFGIGSTYNLAMDVTGRLNKEGGEVALYWKGPGVKKVIYKKYMDANPSVKSVSEITIEDLNEWLSENKVMVMTTRFPVNGQGGAIMTRVKFLHDRQAVIMMGVNDVKYRLEGDNDGDHAQVEFLPEDAEKDFIEHIGSLNIKVLELPDFIKEDNKELSFDPLSRFDGVYELGVGESSIGEISNIISSYGVMSRVYESIGVGGSALNIKIKSPTDKVILPFYHKDGQWEGTVAEFLRLMLQAAVDNSKFGLLGQWGYSREMVVKYLFDWPDSMPSAMIEQFMADAIMPVISTHSLANDIRNGRTYDRLFSLESATLNSRWYSSFVRNRVAEFQNRKRPIKVVLRKDKDGNVVNQIAPIEHIAMSLANMMEEMTSIDKYPMLHRLVSPFIMSIDLQGNAHRQGLNWMNNKKSSFLQEALIKDKEKGNIEFQLDQIRIGEKYAELMSIAFETLIKKYGGEMSAQTVDYNNEFREFTEKYHDMFNELSNTAKLAATYKFLEKPFDKIQVEVGKNTDGSPKIATIEGSSIGLHLPPVSDVYNQATLLSPELMKEYFKEFNKAVSKNSNREDYIKASYKSIYQIAESNCKGG